MPDSNEAMRPTPQPWLKPAGLIGAGLALAVVAGGLVSRVSANQHLATWTAAQAEPTVSVIAPGAPSSDQGLILPGEVQPFYDAQIHARVSGYVKRWYQDIGAPVKAGQILADIDTPELDQQLAQARANLATAAANQRLAESTARRWSSLLAEDAVSRQESDEKSADLEAKTAVVHAAQAEVQRLRALERFKRITAPFDGVVTARTTDIGALVAAGAPNDPGLFTVADIHRLRIYVKVPQSYSADLKPGQIADLTVPEHPGQALKAMLVTASGAVSAQTGTMLVELQTDNPTGALKPGDYAQVRLALPQATQRLTLPASSLMFRQKGMAVATVDPTGHVAMKYLTIARDLGASVEVVGGLGPTDRVIDNPPDSLAAGQAVRVAPPEAGRAKLAQER